MKKKNYIVSKKYVTYAKTGLVLMITMKDIIKSDFILITQENTEQLFMIHCAKNEVFH